MFLRSRSRAAVFLRRTVFLLVPIPIAVGTLRSASHAGFGSFLSIPLSSDIYGTSFVPAQVLNHLFNNRHSDIPGVKNYGNTWLYYPDRAYEESEVDEYDPTKAYTVENLQPFHLGQFGRDFSVAAIKIENETGLGLVKTMSNDSPKVPKSKELEMKKKLQIQSEDNNVVEEYSLNKNDFTNSIFSEKGELQLIIDLNVNFDGYEGFSPTVIDLSQFIVENQAEIPLISISPPSNGTGGVQGQQEDEKITFSLSVKKGSSDDLNFSLIKHKDPSSSSSESLQKAEQVTVSVRNFFLLFSDAPALSFEDIFSQSEQEASSPYLGHQENRIKRIFLDNWTNKNKNTWGTKSVSSRSKRSAPQTNSNPQFDFLNTNSFWKSACSDVYKVGGFIDQTPDTSTSTSSTSSQKPNTSDTSDTYVKQQKSFYEDFDPRTDRLTEAKGSTLKASLPHTTASPCSGLEEETKKLLEEYAKPETGKKTPKKTMVNESRSTIDWNLTPKPIKDLLENNNTSSNTSSNTSKVIQGSFRDWGFGYASSKADARSNGMYDIFKEEALRTEHTFEIKIEKEQIKNKLIEHDKLSKTENNDSKKLNQLKEISSSVQVSIPYSFSIYDPVSNFLNKQRVNLSLSLDLRTIYNQSKSFKEFFSYDMGTNHAVIGTDYGGKSVGTTQGIKYGLSGIISFGAGLYLDLESNLNIQLITKTKGFVSTKKSVCDWRNRVYKSNQSNPQTCEGAPIGSDWQYRKHNHIPPFIVLEINEDPKISSFYFDRRIGASDFTALASSSSESAASAAAASSSSNKKVETLEEFKTSLDKTDRTIQVIKQLDQSNNAEVYFARLDVTDPNSKEQQKAVKTKVGEDGNISVTTESGWFSSTHSWFSYYIPRRHYGEISLDDSNLDELVIHIKGSSALGSTFFQSMHYGTKLTYCRSEKSTVTSTDKQCADGQNYDSIEKDKDNKVLDKPQSVTVKVSFNDLKSATSQESSKKFNFQTVIHRAAGEDANKDTNSFDTNKDKFEFLFKEDGGMAANNTSKSTEVKSKVPNFSLVGVWYSLEMWYDSTNKKLCYYTKLRAISSVAGIGSKASGSNTVANTETHKVPGASARAGFELSKIELNYKKQTTSK